MKKDHFSEKAKDYEKDKGVKNTVKAIAEVIRQEIAFTKEMHIMDFGSGTGFLLEEIAPLVKKITAIDVSPSMNEQLANKKNTISCELDLLEIDLTKETINQKFDVIITSMTLHHIKDTKAILKVFYNLLENGGSLTIADLDKEDGSFHTTDTGVHHFGFDRNEIQNIAKEVGFKEIKTQQASTINKPHGDYTVFTLTAKK